MKKTLITIAVTAIISIALTVILTPIITNIYAEITRIPPVTILAERDGYEYYFEIPQLDLRGYEIDHFQIEQWFLERINYHREEYGIHPYELYTPAVVTSIEHSLDMRDNNFGRNAASDGRTHQQRHDRWLGVDRTKVTSAHSSTHTVEGYLTQQRVMEIVDNVINTEASRNFIMNPTYYYIGIGFSIQHDDRGRLSITMASQPDKREAHRARTPEEREEYRQAYLEMVRANRTNYRGD